MEKRFRLPVASCDECQADLELRVVLSGVRLSALTVDCTACESHTDLLEGSRHQVARSKESLKRASREAARSIREARRFVPRDREDVKEALRNPKHPFTAAVLTGLVIVAMELSGFGIYMAVTTLLAALVLNPVGWVVVPLVVAIAFAYRGKLKSDRLEKLKGQIDDLEKQKEEGLLTPEQFEAARDELVTKLLS